MKSLRTPYLVLLFASVGLLASCARQPLPEAYDAPGFFMGLWNGFTIFFALIGHIFDSSIRIYAFPNSGGWYDFARFPPRPWGNPAVNGVPHSSHLTNHFSGRSGLNFRRGAAATLLPSSNS